MITRRQWGSRAITEADLGSTIQITRPPQQYPLGRVVCVLTGTFTIGAVGAVDYVTGPQFQDRQFRRLQWQLGSANFLKDVPGYSNHILNNIHAPNIGAENLIPQGLTLTTADTLFVRTIQVIDFADLNTINGANSTLIPSLYPDLQLNVTLETLENLCTAGDWDYTFSGFLSVTVEQVTDLKVNVNTLLKEFTQISDITSTGTLAIDLPTSTLISEMMVVPLVDGLPDVAAFDLAESFKVNVESGTVILDERYYQDVQAIDAMDSASLFGSAYLGGAFPFPAPYLHYNLDFNHDGRELFDNRQVKKWQLEVPAVVGVGTTNQVLIHFTGKTPVRS